MTTEYHMSIMTLALVIVASFAGGGSYYLSARGGTGAWLSMTLGLLAFGVVMALAPLTVP